MEAEVKRTSFDLNTLCTLGERLRRPVCSLVRFLLGGENQPSSQTQSQVRKPRSCQHFERILAD